MIIRTLLVLFPALALAQTPSIDTIVDFGTGAAGPVAVGGLISITGSNLASGMVTLSGQAVPVVSASAAQVVALVPFDFAQGAAGVTVSVGGNPSNSKTITVTEVAPGVIRWWTSGTRTTSGIRRGEYLIQQFLLGHSETVTDYLRPIHSLRRKQTACWQPCLFRLWSAHASF